MKLSNHGARRLSAHTSSSGALNPFHGGAISLPTSFEPSRRTSHRSGPVLQLSTNQAPRPGSATWPAQPPGRLRCYDCRAT